MKTTDNQQLKDNIMEHSILDTQNITAGASIIFGAFVGAIRKTMNLGWKSWVWFFSSMFVNIFVGIVAYLLAIQYQLGGLYPIIVALTFGFIGEKGGDILIAVINDYLKSKFGTNGNNK